jgi:hypothetical protein
MKKYLVAYDNGKYFPHIVSTTVKMPDDYIPANDHTRELRKAVIEKDKPTWVNVVSSNAVPHGIPSQVITTSEGELVTDLSIHIISVSPLDV